MSIYRKNLTNLLPVTAVAVLCTAGIASAQELSWDIDRIGASTPGGIAGASCGGTQLTQNTDPNTIAAGTVRCGAGTPAIPTDNFYARSFAIAADTQVNCVDFAVRSNTGAAPTPSNPWPVRVRLYLDTNGGAPDTASLQLIPGSEAHVTIPVLAAPGQFFTVNYTPGIIVKGGSTLVVELFQACRQTTCTTNPPPFPPTGDGSSGLSLGTNSAGESGPTYIKAPACAALADYVTMASIGFPQIHGIINLGVGTPDPCAQPLPFCNGDVVQTGNVDTDDLLAVINTWGDQGPPRPLGDCAPLPNGNCFVDTDDLLAVINQWGECDLPTGACCFANGSCLTLTGDDCAKQGGNYNGDGSSCGTVNCPVLPANDECSGALPLEDGSNATTNLNATTSTGIPGGACAFGGAGNFTRDVWYTYNASGTGELTVSACGTAAPVTDTVISIFSGTCGSLVELACDDDSCAAPSPELLSTATTTLNAAGTYFIRVGSWQNGPTGPLSLNVTFTPIDNDGCEFATSVAVPSVTTGSMVGATQDTAPDCNTVPPGIGRWYSVIGNGNTLTASTCVPNNFPKEQTRLSVYCGTSCDNLFCVTAADDNSCSFFQETVTWCSAPGQEYLILVSNPEATGNFTLTISNGAICNDPIECSNAPDNDDCADAFPIALGLTNFTTVNATTDGVPNAAGQCNDFGANQTFADIWYNFTATQTGQLTVTTCADLGGATSYDSDIVIYNTALPGGNTCPPADTARIGCNDDDPNNPCGTAAPFASTAVANIVAGGVYKIRVGGWGALTDQGTGTLNLTIGGVPTGACCVNNSCVGNLTQAACNALCGDLWFAGQDCASFDCNGNTGDLACADAVAGNGPANGVNGTQPNIAALGGWSNTFGLMAGVEFCNAATVDSFTFEFIDTSTPTGSLGTYTSIQVRVYNIPAGGLATLDPANPGTPLLNQTFTTAAGGGAVKSLTGQIFFGGDVERWELTLPAPLALAPNTYAVFVTMGSQPAAGGYFLATGNATGTVPQRFSQWGIAAPPESEPTFWAGGAQDNSICVGD